MNIAYMMAKIMEQYPESEHEEQMEVVLELHTVLNPCIYADEFWERFFRFRFYYGIHLKEQGKHLPDEN